MKAVLRKKATGIALVFVMLLFVGGAITIPHPRILSARTAQFDPEPAFSATVTIPGNASGYFGNPPDEIVPLVPALTVSGPGTITITYVSGTVTDSDGVNTGPNGVTCPNCGPIPYQLPLEEGVGVSSYNQTQKVDALIGVFVPASRVNAEGFKAVDGTKDVTRVGIEPSRLFFVGTGTTLTVCEAGTLFLGINDYHVGDNGGSFTVTVTGPAPNQT